MVAPRPAAFPDPYCRSLLPRFSSDLDFDGHRASIDLTRFSSDLDFDGHRASIDLTRSIERMAR